MKRIAIFTMLLILSTSSFSQTNNPSQTLTRIDYRQKSKNQKTAAWILLGGGAGLATTGLIIGSSSNSFADNKLTTGAILVVAGGAAMIGSIPFFIASGKNKRKAIAANAFFRMERAPVLQGLSMSHSYYPALSVKIKLD